jgi:hypothetical protein
MINYSVGLNHAGSFITAGRPWTKKISLTNGQEQVIQFPFVSKGIQVTKMSSSDPNGLLRVGFSSMLGGGSLPIQTRALDINGSTGFEKYSFTGANIVEYSISVWIKVDDLPTNSTDRKRIVELDVAGAQHSVQSYISGADTVFRLLLNGANASPIEASVAQNTGWIHLVVTTGSGSSILYVNGNPILTNANTVTNLNGIVIGGDAAGYTGVYDEMTLWDKKLSSLEVSELL